MILIKAQEDKIQEIKERLNNTTEGKWIAHIPEDECDDPTIMTNDEVYICQTTYDTLSSTTNHKVIEDTIFIANAKEDIRYLIELIKDKKREKSLF